MTLLDEGYYVTDEGHILRVITNKAGTRSYALRMIESADEDGCKIIEWIYWPGLGRDLLIAALKPHDVAARIRAVVAA